MPHGAHDSIVFNPNLIGGRVADVFLVSLGENEVLDPKPVHMSNQDCHALFRRVSRKAPEMAVRIPNSERAIEVEFFIRSGSTLGNTVRDEPRDKTLQNCSPIQRHLLQYPTL